MFLLVLPRFTIFYLNRIVLGDLLDRKMRISQNNSLCIIALTENIRMSDIGYPGA